MAKSLFYRRSFHSDRDLLGISPLELDQVLGGPPSRKGLEGLEAPRNSLEIQASCIQAEARGDSHSRPDQDIPMGFELTRSLTTPKKRDDQSQPKFMQFSEITKAEPEQKRRSTNVIARLMGLDFMPVSGGARSSKGAPAEKRPKKQDRLVSVHSLTDLPAQEWHAEFENERKPREALSFRDHPQEQQLQEFKREFACRLAAQAENVRLKEADVRQTSKSVRGHEIQAPADQPKCAASRESAPAGTGAHIAAPANTSNSGEFMEALQFLQANKKLFLEVLQNRKSSMSAALQQAVRGKPLGRTKPSKAADTSQLEARKKRLEGSTTSNMVRAGKSRLRNANQQGKSDGGSAAKEPSSRGGWRHSAQKKFQPNETMPLQRRKRSLAAEHGHGNCGGGGNRKVERIVVLKPSSQSEIATDKTGGMICTLHSSSRRAQEKADAGRFKGKPLRDVAEAALLGRSKLGRRNGGGVSDIAAAPRQQSGGSLPGSPRRGNGGQMGGVDARRRRRDGISDAAVRSGPKHHHRPPIVPVPCPAAAPALPDSIALPTPPIDAHDSSSETSCTDKCEQPSPVSVLDNAATWPSHNQAWRTYAHLAPPNADFHLRDIRCPASKRQHLLYVRDILVAAGFSAHGIAVVRCFSTQHGLDPGLLRLLENQCCRKRFHPPVPSSDCATLHAWDRRLLFDAVDHIILNKLGMPSEPHDPWLRTSKPCFYFMGSGKNLLQQIWAEISFDSVQDFDSADEETLEDLVARDLSRSFWVSTRSELEYVGLSIETLIFDSLVEEAIHDFTTP